MLIGRHLLLTSEAIMSVLWQNQRYGITVDDDPRGGFWLKTSDATPSAFRQKPYRFDGYYESEGDLLDVLNQLLQLLGLVERLTGMSRNA